MKDENVSEKLKRQLGEVGSDILRLHDMSLSSGVQG